MKKQKVVLVYSNGKPYTLRGDKISVDTLAKIGKTSFTVHTSKKEHGVTLANKATSVVPTSELMGYIKRDVGSSSAQVICLNTHHRTEFLQIAAKY